MTHDDHDTTLATIEAHLLTAGTPLEDIDARVAEVLGVPVDYYFAYRLVAGAIDTHHRRPLEPDPCSPEQAAAALVEAQRTSEAIGLLVAAVYRAATGSGTTREVASHAARLTTLRLTLSEQLHRAALLTEPFEQPVLPFDDPDPHDDRDDVDGPVGERLAVAAGGGR